MLETNKRGFAVEAVEFNAWQNLLAVMPSALKAAIGADHRLVGGVLSISARNIPLVTFNRAIGLGLERPAERGDLRAIADHMRQFSAPVAQLQIAPFALSPALEADLGAEGFRRLPTTWAKMGRRSANPPVVETGFMIDMVGPEEAQLFASTVIAGFGMPPSFVPWLEALPGRDRWRCYVVRSAGETIAAGAMFVDVDSAWLGMAATLPTARKRGAQSALIARRIADAADLGKPWVFTETGILDGPNPSLANMYRAGFECLHERTNWALDS
jgi:hypothetical protein